ncbi:serine hydrolase domain-containing protein [Ectobacillus panaciterrae]|uniref:serine hydrolase domain-containing protein n=1 Tax=Ectobacillus panaciterrae TaxID=363872 RepID=UPI000405A747|nr:serine hydrolase [Ectobacillus panaciterrae]
MKTEKKMLLSAIAACCLLTACAKEPKKETHQETNTVTKEPSGGMMTGFPPSPEQTVTKENWMQDPYIRWSLSHMREMIQTKQVWRGTGNPAPLKYAPKNLNNFTIADENGEPVALQQFLTQTKTDAFLVMHEGKVVYEEYFNNTEPHEQHWMASLTKVFTGLLVSTLADEGKIDMTAKASSYLPELENTAFGNATVQQLMDMQVSADFPTHGFEKSGLGNQDAQLFLASGQLPAIKGGPASIYDMLKEAQEQKEPGTAFSYNNGSAETLGWIVRRVTGKSLAKVMEERIWLKLHPEEDAYYVSDLLGTEQASAGLAATLRDMARFGDMVLNHGMVNGKRILPETIFSEIAKGGNQQLFIESATEIDKPSYSYHNLWWITNNENKAFEVTGSYGQRLYIDPKAKMVIVHLSSNADHNMEIQDAYSNAYLKIAHFLMQQKK